MGFLAVQGPQGNTSSCKGRVWCSLIYRWCLPCSSICAHVHAQSHQSFPILCDPMDCNHQALHPWDSPGKNTWVAMPSSREFSQHRDLGIEPVSPATPALQADSLSLSYQGSLLIHLMVRNSFPALQGKWQYFTRHSTHGFLPLVVMKTDMINLSCKLIQLSAPSFSP